MRLTSEQAAGLLALRTPAERVKWLVELVSGTSGLGWVAIKAVLIFAVAVIGLRLVAAARRRPGSGSPEGKDRR
jgi:hypothetical protein